MRILSALSCMLLVTTLSGCDFRSETAKREMEKFNGTPTPTFAPTPTEAPIDPAAVVQVDTSVMGTVINVDGDNKTKSITCTKLDRVMINGNRAVLTIKGACRQILINGSRNQITGDAVMEIAFNGEENTVRYSRYINGKRPIVKGAAGNTIEEGPTSGATK